MQLQYAGHEVEPEQLSVYLNHSARKPFAVLSIARMQVFISSAEDADELIKLAVEAKRLLLGHAEPEPAAARGDRDEAATVVSA